MATPKQAAQDPNGSPEQERRTDATAPAQGEVTAQRQQQVALQIDTLLELLENAAQSDVDQWYAENFVTAMQEVDRLHQLLGMTTAGRDRWTAFAKKNESL